MTFDDNHDATHPSEIGEAGREAPPPRTASKHCNGDDEFGGMMPDFVDFPNRPDHRGVDGEIDEAAFAAAIERRRLAGWTAQRMRLFILRLADTGNVHQCCRELGLSRQSVYALRRRNETFRRAWEGAALRSRDALLDEAWNRAYNGPVEEVVLDGRLIERQGRPDGAMLRYLLTRADRLARDGALSARPAQTAKPHLEALIDCLDPERADRDEETPDEDALLAEIGASGQFDRQQGAAPAGPLGYASDTEALEALTAYKKYSAMAPEDIDTSDIDPDNPDGWTEDQWLRADLSGFADRVLGADEEEDEDEDEAA